MKPEVKDTAEVVARTMIGRPHDWRLRRPVAPKIPARGPHWIGPAMALFSTLVGWFAFNDTIGRSGTAFALFIGSVSIMLMAWSNLLSTRISALEQLFGGVDRMYRWHRWFGALSVVAMWLHTQTVDDVKGIAGASRDVAKTAESLASTGTNILYALVGLSLLRWLPTRWWRISHKFLILPFVFASWHFYTATKPYANDSAWGRWFGAFMLLGIAAWAYRVIWRDMIRKGRLHRVVGVERRGDNVALELEPVGAPMRHALGQFAFIKIDRPGMREPHPFTIASAPDDRSLRFVIRDLGDWSHDLDHRVAIGDRVIVEGPYGRLEPFPATGHGPVVWIAGGVGITPFLGAARSGAPAGSAAPHLFFCVRSRDDAPGLDELIDAHEAGRIVLHVHASDEGARLSADDLSQVFGADGLRNAHVVMCGPTALVRDMTAAATSLGARHVHVEGFDIRTGIGPDLSRHIDRLLAAWQPRFSHPPSRAVADPDDHHATADDEATSRA